MSKSGNELVQSAREAVAHAQGKIQLKQFSADMPQEERDQLLEEICAPDQETGNSSVAGESSLRQPTAAIHRPTAARRVAASGRKR